MILSMTGFSSYTTVLPVKKGGEKFSVIVELKTLNSRFFELVCKLPSSLNFLEIPITNYLKQKLVRGRVFLSIKVGGGGEVFEKVVPVSKIVKDYIAAAKFLKKKFSLQGELTIVDIVSLENVFSFEREAVGKEFERAMIAIVEKATTQLLATRKTEGGRLQKDLARRFSVCENHMEQVAKLFAEFMKKKKEELKDMLILVENGDKEAEQQLNERYELLNKIDVHEEIVRFKSHLKNASKVLRGKELESGKRLEFILQELSREINTIAAKCSHFDISSMAVEIKVELEKVREQVQNIV